jgi:hypothetical protein
MDPSTSIDRDRANHRRSDLWRSFAAAIIDVVSVRSRSSRRRVRPFCFDRRPARYTSSLNFTAAGAEFIHARTYYRQLVLRTVYARNTLSAASRHITSPHTVNNPSLITCTRHECADYSSIYSPRLINKLWLSTHSPAYKPAGNTHVLRPHREVYSTRRRT